MTKIKNTSSAVMQQRHESRDSLDDFPTPPWATRALCEWLLVNTHEDLFLQTVLEPACNRGYMARPLTEYFDSVIASDIHHYGDEHYEHAVECNDFINGGEWQGIEWVITNPPFTLAADFIEQALDTASVGVAVIVRSAFLEGRDRYHKLFSQTPPTYVLQFVERVPMVKGCYDPKVSSATAYCWLVWLKSEEHVWTRLDWIAPCRKALEKPEDKTYPPSAPATWIGDTREQDNVLETD